MAIRGNSNPSPTVKPFVPRAEPVAPAPAIVETEGTSAKALGLVEEPALEGTIEPLEGIVLTPDPTGGLVAVKGRPALEIFTAPGLVPAILKLVTVEACRGFVPDLTTEKGRKAIASRAYRVAQTKTYLEDLGKKEVARLKELPTQIDAGRKILREGLDVLRDSIRKPLDDWEAQRKAEEEAAALARQIESDHEIALLFDEKRTRDLEERRRAEEQAQKEREEQIRKDAEAKAQREAEDRVREEREASERRERESREAAEKAQREMEAAEQRAKDAEARAELERKAAAEREEQARIEATQAAERRQREAEEQQRRETEKREADVEHRRTFNRDAWMDVQSVILAQANPADAEAMATEIIKAIVSGKVRHVSISY